jgi:alpha(1,3/1,4) fucosyltransferase
VSKPASGIAEAKLSPIRIFRADPMTNTPFDPMSAGNPILAAAGVTYVDDPAEADLIIGRRIRFLKQLKSYDKAFAIWTHEPRFNYETAPVLHHRTIRNPVQIMNAYTGVYCDEFYNFPGVQLEFDAAMRAFARKPRRAVMLASYHRPPTHVVHDRFDNDLLQYRQNLALYLQERGFCDVYGRNWPATVKILGNSRLGDWRAAKQVILESYAINICFENTIIPQYVTEKIWDAIAGASLPVYHGARNGIYGLFPAHSFIEADGKSVQELGDEILTMPKEEMAGRYEACLRAYLALYRQDRQSCSRRACDKRTVAFLRNAIAEHAARKNQMRSSPWLRLSVSVRPAARIASQIGRQLSSLRAPK